MFPMYVPATHTFLSQCNACGVCGACGVCVACAACTACGPSPGVAVNSALLAGVGGAAFVAMAIHLKKEEVSAA
jgi:hypothetical protein